MAVATLKPRPGLVLVEPIREPEETDSGIIIARKYEEEASSGHIVAIGDERDAWCQCEGAGACLGCLIKQKVNEIYGSKGVDFLMAMIRRPRQFGVGDLVAFAKSSGHDIAIEGEPYIVLKESDVLAVVNTAA